MSINKLAVDVVWSAFHANFTPSEIKKYVPSNPGVYMLWVQEEDRSWFCFYCGKASNLESRLFGHLSQREDNDQLKTIVTDYVCGFVYAEIFDENHQAGIEKFLYDHYQPVCNEVDPGGDPIEPGLLPLI